MRKFALLILCSMNLGFVNCGTDADVAENQSNTIQSKKLTAAQYPIPDDPQLAEGRAVWMETCKNCHATGLAGAPKAGDIEAWKLRIAQGEEVLFTHAIEGFLGPSGTQMPAKGGEKSLTDEQVKKAVLYMISISQ